jgi:hypothetical protein
MNGPQILIALDPSTGAVQVSGPLEQKVLCYGLLQAALVAVQEHKPSVIHLPFSRPPRLPPDCKNEPGPPPV